MTTQIEVRERPILFSGPMIRAILDGRKTQTRRVIKPQPDYLWHDDPCSNDKGYISCPYGKPGDRLWCRETFALSSVYDRDSGNEGQLPGTLQGTSIWYKAGGGKAFKSAVQGRWRPSIFMPRWACRITLEITNVRVERLQEISNWDARNEGVQDVVCGYYCDESVGHVDDQYISGFQKLWDSINGKKHPWSSNPWVFVVEFRRVEAR